MSKKVSFLVIAATAIAGFQAPALGRDIEFDGIVIPSQQATSPAGHEDIAFRPACQQTGQQLLGDATRTDGTWGPSVAHTLNLPDGSVRTLVVYPSMSLTDAHALMDTQGYCKEMGASIPIVFADQVPERQVGQFTADLSQATKASKEGIDVEASGNEPLPVWAIALGGVLLLVFIGGAIYMARQDGRSVRGDSFARKKANAKSGASAQLSEIFGGGEE
ncbi:MAG: hypothetical protein AAF609_18550 [Cyanobacteria bacterium P01_C01_bin.120]